MCIILICLTAWIQGICKAMWSNVFISVTYWLADISEIMLKMNISRRYLSIREYKE